MRRGLSWEELTFGMVSAVGLQLSCKDSQRDHHITRLHSHDSFTLAAPLSSSRVWLAEARFCIQVVRGVEPVV